MVDLGLLGSIFASHFVTDANDSGVPKATPSFTPHIENQAVTRLRKGPKTSPPFRGNGLVS